MKNIWKFLYFENVYTISAWKGSSEACLSCQLNLISGVVACMLHWSSWIFNIPASRRAGDLCCMFPPIPRLIMSALCIDSTLYFRFTGETKSYKSKTHLHSSKPQFYIDMLCKAMLCWLDEQWNKDKSAAGTSE